MPEHWVTPMPHSSNRLNAERFYAEGCSLINKGRPSEAATRFEEAARNLEVNALTNERIYADVLMGRAEALRISREYILAAKVYERAGSALGALRLDNAPIYSLCLLGWADALRRSGEYVRAVETYKQAAASFEIHRQTNDPRYADLLYGWGESLGRSGMYAPCACASFLHL